MTGGVGELVQIVVRLPQRFVGSQQFLRALGHPLLQRCVQFADRLVRSPAFGDIANRGSEQQPFFGLQRAQADLDRKLVAVLAARPQLRGRSQPGRAIGLGGLRVALHSGTSIRMFCPISSSRGNANMISPAS